MALKIKVGIFDSSGYVFNELIRLLLTHPRVELIHLKNDSANFIKKSPGNKIELTDINGSSVSKKDINQIDLIFITGEPETGALFLKFYNLPKKVKIICLTGEFREAQNSLFEGRKFIYGLPELKKGFNEKAINITIPGGMATCVALGLLPIAQKKLLKDVYTTGISGSTEDHSAVDDNQDGKIHKVKSAQIATDNILHEIKQSLATISKEYSKYSINFVPWKGEFSRGIFVTSQLKCTESLSEMYYIFEKFYEDRKFIHISKEPVFLKKVINTNDCYINLEKAGDILVVHSAIDNLMKGAAGQAIQNMNLMFGFDETLGLIPKSRKCN